MQRADFDVRPLRTLYGLDENLALVTAPSSPSDEQTEIMADPMEKENQSTDEQEARARKAFAEMKKNLISSNKNQTKTMKLPATGKAMTYLNRQVPKSQKRLVQLAMEVARKQRNVERMESEIAELDKRENMLKETIKEMKGKQELDEAEIAKQERTANRNYGILLELENGAKMHEANFIRFKNKFLESEEKSNTMQAKLNAAKEIEKPLIATEKRSSLWRSIREKFSPVRVFCSEILKKESFKFSHSSGCFIKGPHVCEMKSARSLTHHFARSIARLRGTLSSIYFINV